MEKRIGRRGLIAAWAGAIGLVLVAPALTTQSVTLVAARPSVAQSSIKGGDGSTSPTEPPPAHQTQHQTQVTASATDWPMWRHNPQRHAHNTAFAIVHPHTVGDLQQKWRQNLGGVINSSAAVAGNSVFVGSNNRSLYALHAETGGVKWQFATGGTVESSPAVADSRVFFTSSDGRLYALDAATGKLLWSKKERFSVSSPLVVEATTRSASRIYVGSASGHVHAYDYDGNLQWKYHTGDSIESSPAIATVRGTEVLYVGSNDNYVYAIETRTHQLVWRAQTRGDVTATPAVDGESVYVGSRDGVMYALNAADGAQLWAYPTNGPLTASVAVGEPGFGRNSHVYFGSHDGALYAVDAGTGALTWATRFDAPVLSSAALGAGVLYVGTGYSVSALDPCTGAILWSGPTAGAVNASPSLSQALLVVGSADNHFYAFALPRRNASPEAGQLPGGGLPPADPPPVAPLK